MNPIQHNPNQFGSLSSGICQLLLSLLPLLVPVWAQPAAINQAAADIAPGSNALPAGKNSYIAGGNVHSRAPVTGNLYAAGGRITVEHPVQGDASLAGGAVSVLATIKQDLRVAGGNIAIDSAVGGKLLASGGNITLGRAAEVAQAATLYAGNATMEGKVDGPLTVYAEKIVLDGEVKGDVEINAEQIELGPRAKIGGALRYSGNAEFKTAEGVVIGGAITRGGAMNGRPDIHHDRQWHGQMMGGRTGWGNAIGSTLFGAIALLALAALFLSIFTDFSQRVSVRMLAAPWTALAAGAAVFLGTPMLAMLLLVTLVGIPLGLVLMLLFPLLLLTGWIVGVFALSQRVRRAVQKQPGRQSQTAVMVSFAVTLLAILLIGSLPAVGFVVLVAIALLGTGACALDVYSQVKSGASAPAPRIQESSLVKRQT